jgi:hypothetical protein
MQKEGICYQVTVKKSNMRQRRGGARREAKSRMGSGNEDGIDREYRRNHEILRR